MSIAEAVSQSWMTVPVGVVVYGILCGVSGSELDQGTRAEWGWGRAGVVCLWFVVYKGDRLRLCSEGMV